MSINHEGGASEASYRLIVIVSVRRTAQTRRIFTLSSLVRESVTFSFKSVSSNDSSVCHLLECNLNCFVSNWLEHTRSEEQQQGRGEKKRSE